MTHSPARPLQQSGLACGQVCGRSSARGASELLCTGYGYDLCVDTKEGLFLALVLKALPVSCGSSKVDFSSWRLGFLDCV
jgi:hypothetical protein